MKMKPPLIVLAAGLMPLGCQPKTDTVVTDNPPADNKVVVVQPGENVASSQPATVPATTTTTTSTTGSAAAPPNAKEKAKTGAKGKAGAGISDESHLTPPPAPPGPKSDATTPNGQAGKGDKSMHKTASGLQYQDLTVGTGATPKTGQTVSVHYTGWLMNGTKFESSKDRNEPYSFAIGQREVIPGWDEGIASMKVGGKRILIIPSDLAYGPQGNGSIPPDATLKFEVELLSVQ